MSVSSTPSISIAMPASAGSDNSWLSAIAKALAKAMSTLQARMVDDSKHMNAGKGASDSAVNKANDFKTDLTVATQEYTMIVDAINTVLKGVGQADNQLVQKQ